MKKTMMSKTGGWQAFFRMITCHAALLAFMTITTSSLAQESIVIEINGGESNSEQNAVNSHIRKECTLALQLNDPLIRSDYLSMIEYGQKYQASLSVEDMYSNIQSSSFDNELPTVSFHDGNRILDPISMECISCHDGTLAGSVHYRVNGPNYTAFNIKAVTGSHPVGMDYTRYTNKKDYAPFYELPKNMVLMDGRIGCLTCHDMLGKNMAYLSTDLNNSNLCFACHRK